MGCQPSKHQAKCIKQQNYFKNKSFDSTSRPILNETKKTRKWSDSTDTDSPVLRLPKKKQVQPLEQKKDQKLPPYKREKIWSQREQLSNSTRNIYTERQHLTDSKKSTQTMEESIVLQVYCNYNDEKQTIIDQLEQHKFKH